MLYEVEGNLVENNKYYIFCHQTNCQGIMGAGIAKQIAAKYPIVAEYNKYYCNKKNALGTCLPIRVNPSRICVNLYGQDKYGRDKQYTDYNALQQALDNFAARVSKVSKEWTIGFPYKMGCGLGGGDWTKVRMMIVDFSKKGTTRRLYC